MQNPNPYSPNFNQDGFTIPGVDTEKLINSAPESVHHKKLAALKTQLPTTPEAVEPAILSFEPPKTETEKPAVSFENITLGGSNDVQPEQKTISEKPTLEIVEPIKPETKTIKSKPDLTKEITNEIKEVPEIKTGRFANNIKRFFKPPDGKELLSSGKTGAAGMENVENSLNSLRK